MKLSLLLLSVLLRTSFCRLGRLCSSNTNCSASGGEVCGERGYCVCRAEEDLHISFSLKPRCSPEYSLYGRSCGASWHCPWNAECNPSNKCVCKAGYVYYENECTTRRVSKVLQKCGKFPYGVVFFCDFRDQLECTSKICHCFQEFYLNYTTRRCEPKSDFIRAYNLTEYRVKPELYCQNKAQCIEGLECKDFKCSCPEGCKYKAAEEVCDCGRPAESRTAPIITGCFLGCLIIYLWIKACEKAPSVAEKLRQRL